MGENDSAKPSAWRLLWRYELHALRFAWSESRAELRAHMKVAAAAAIAGVVMGAVLGILSDIGGGSAIRAAKGAGGALTLEAATAAVLFLFNLVTAPAKIREADLAAIGSVQQQKDEKQPAVELQLVRRDGSGSPGAYVFLEVINVGGTADFFAEISAEGNVYWPPGMRYAAWSNNREQRCRISEGARAFIELAYLHVSVRPTAKWSFREWWKPRDGIMYDVKIPTGPASYAMYKSGGEHDASLPFEIDKEETYRETVVSLALYAEPPLSNGPRRVAVRLWGSSAELV